MEKYSTNPGSNKWDKHKSKQFKPAKEPASGVTQVKDVSTGYEDYLVLLQERNRLLKKLKEKDSKQIELEKKEQGFSLYVNGANADLARILPPSTAKGRAPSRQTKTADTYSQRRKQLEFELQWLEKEVGEVRAKTAPIPDQAPRREWQPDLIEIKTSKGSRLQVKAPGVLSGLYSEDFEATEDHDDDDNDDDDDDVLDSYLNLSDDLPLEDNSGDEDELTLSMNDVETLRKSLEADQSIQESIRAAQERIRLEKETGKSKDESDEDEIEEELEGASSSLNLAELDRLPHLTPITSTSIEVKNKSTPSANKQSISFEIPIHDEPEEKNDKPVQPVSKEKTFVKESTPKDKQTRKTGNISDEDMVVLSFSNKSKSKKERVLSSTRRKQDTDSIVSSTPKKERNTSQSVEIGAQSKDGQVELKCSAQKAKARSLSSSAKKKTNEHFANLDNNADEIFKAMALENQNIDISSCCKTAPENRTDNMTGGNQDNVMQRPASIASTKDKTISRVTQKVRAMDPRQQQHLISLLSKLEIKDPPFKGSAPMTSTGRGSPMKATVDYSSSTVHSVNSEHSSSITTSVETSLASSKGAHSVDSSLASQQDDGVDVNIEIQSNWGHPNTLGITEVQFFSDNGSLISYHANGLSVSGFFGDQGLIANIGNAKTKTNKAKYMWCCQFIPGSPVEIVFHLPVNQQSLSKIIIWNFNGGVRDLNMGIKDVRIFVGGMLMWKGTVDKGCGNQVFDYSTVINLHEPQTSVSTSLSVQPPVRSETVVLNKSYEETQQNTGNLPVIDTSAVDSSLRTSRSKDVSISSSITIQKPSSYSPSPGCSFMSRTPDHKGHGSFAESLSKRLVDSAEGKLVTRSSSTPNLSSNSGANLDVGEDPLRGDSAALPSKPPWLQSNNKPRSRSSSRSKSRPIWLPGDDASVRSESPQRSNSCAETRARPRGSPDLVPGTTTTRCRSTGERSYSLPGKQEEWPENFASRKEETLPTCLDSDKLPNNEKKRPESRHAKQKAPSPIPSSQPPDHVMQPRPSGDPEPNKSSISKRQQWRMEQSISLEESWNVLSMFEKSHKGRITNNMDLQNQDDALDKFLSSEVNKPEPGKDAQQQSDQTDYRPMDEGVIRTSQEIPTLPKGKQLVINILSTWGDRHYVGLNGIEIFTEYGKPAKILEVTADPLDINMLPDYGSDPRVVTNLVDGIFRTRDDMHLWMAPFTPRENHYICITFTEPIKIAMLRIWNYNKSRIHSYRGAKDIEITLDNNLIFEGEIQRASGTLGQDEPFGDTILFTMDEEILDAMALYDQTYEIPDDEDSLIYSQDYDRPSTADRADHEQDNEDRPFTQARQRRTTDEDDDSTDGVAEVVETAEDAIPCGQVLELYFVATWGDPYYMGLTGLELFGPNMETVPIQFHMMEAIPRDLNELPNYGDDDRTLDKIIDGVNVTTSDEHMWLIPFTEGEDHTLTINLQHKTQLLGMRMWNYNKSPNDTFRGARLVHVKLDGRVLSPSEGFLIRKGPGNIYFDFAQDIYFVKSASSTLRHMETAAQADEPHRRPESRVNIKKLVPDYEPTLMPTGFVFQFQLLSSWGDPYYIGLNGIQLYDDNGYRIHLNESNVTAHPHSVNVLDDVMDDIRTPDKLIDGVYDTNDGRHMWLAPIVPGQKNLIFVIFDEPVTVSMVKMWNYSKTPIRGVQQFVLLVDDLLVYHGILPQVPTGGAILPGLDLPVPHHTVLFTDREQIAMAERKNVVRSIDMEQDVQLTNDKRIVTRYADPKSAGKTADPALRPKTSVKSLSSKRTR